LAQSAGHGKRAKWMNCRYAITCRQCGNFIRPAKEERIGADGERASPKFDDFGEGGLDIADCACLQEMYLDTKLCLSRSRIVHFGSNNG
jgi:hypothetical protein